MPQEMREWFKFRFFRTANKEKYERKQDIYSI